VSAPAFSGSEDVATKLAASIRLLGLSRFDLAYAVERVPHEQRMATIELYGREVIPRVRELLAAAPDYGNASSSDNKDRDSSG
jgi:hypothetical protein